MLTALNRCSKNRRSGTVICNPGSIHLQTCAYLGKAGTGCKRGKFDDRLRKGPLVLGAVQVSFAEILTI